jgi:hypothetical protein
MTKRSFFFGAVLLMGWSRFSGACNDTIAANNCRVKCEDTDNICVQKCTDDMCKTVCKTDLDNCTASCDSITSTPPDGGR